MLGSRVSGWGYRVILWSKVSEHYYGMGLSSGRFENKDMIM